MCFDATYNTACFEMSKIFGDKMEVVGSYKRTGFKVDGKVVAEWKESTGHLLIHSDNFAAAVQAPGFKMAGSPFGGNRLSLANTIVDMYKY